jgi:hypothetical protein
LPKADDITGLNRLIKTMKNTSKSRFGFRQELAYLATKCSSSEIAKIEFISRYSKIGDNITDLDAVLLTKSGEIIIAQVKRSRSAFRTKSNVLEWIEKATEYAIEHDIKVYKIEYAAPAKDQFPNPSSPKKEAEDLDIIIDISTPFKNCIQEN